MGAHAAPSRRSSWRPFALAVLAGLVLMVSGAGVLAVLQAVATGSQSVATGNLTLVAAANGTFGTTISGLAPGDLVHRFVTLTNTGTLDGAGLTLSVSGTGTDLVGTGPGALRLSVSECSVAWTPGTVVNGNQEGGCAGTQSTDVINGRTLPLVAVPLPAGTLAAGTGKRYLRLSLRVPDNSEVTTNGTPPPGSVQGKSTDLTFSFTEDQRTGTVTSS